MPLKPLLKHTFPTELPLPEALPQKSESLLDTVSTTCDSGWVRSRAATDQSLHKINAADTDSTDLLAGCAPARYRRWY